MKPELLTLYNIGPFVNEHKINFNLLDDFFLISGKTGSGKTTILDSITYVLYGTLPGAKKNVDTKNIRTDYCNQQDLSYVDFIFSINSNYYRVKRTLPYIYKTRNSTTRKEGEVTEFYSLKNIDDKQGLLISNQKAEADKKIKDLLQLNVEEFSKIVLLPQGEFATFLRQSSTERKNMLSKLFPVDNFKKITDFTKEKKIELESKLEQVIEQLNFITKDFNLENYDNEKTNFEKTITNNNTEITNKQNRLYEIAGTIEKIQSELSVHIEIEKLNKDLEILLQSENEINIKKEKISKAKKALELFPLVKNLETKQKLVDETKDELSYCKKILEELIFKSKKLKEQENEILDTEKQIKILEKNYTKLEESFNTLTQLETNKNNLQNTLTKFKSAKNEISLIEKEKIELDSFLKENNFKIDEKEILLKEIFDKENILKKVLANKKYKENEIFFQEKTSEEENLKSIIEKHKLFINEIKNQIELEKQNEIAQTLASTLQENSPCPVCGSVHHPNPAKKILNNISNQEKLILEEHSLNEAETKLQNIQREKNIFEGISINLKQQIDLSIKDNPEEIENTIFTLKEKISKLENLEKKLQEEKEKLNKINEDYEKKLNILNNLTQEKNLFEDRITNLTINLKDNISQDIKETSEITSLRNYIETKFENTKTKLKEFNSIVEDFNNEKNENSTQLTKFQEKNNLLDINLKKFTNELNIETENLNLKIKESIFTSVNEIKENHLEENLILNYETLIEQWTKEKEKTQTLLKEKQNSISTEKNILSEKLKQYEFEKNNFTEKLNLLIFETTEIEKKLSALNKCKENFDNTENQRLEISEKLKDYVKLFKLLSGDNPKKIDIMSWILEMYLQEIINFANIRLEKISDGRYNMKVNTEKESNRGAKGLDIDIFDSFTGKSRPCNTLSGGETFMASISLALAISDTVQSKKGGIQLESLFIDEGFGSLDEHSLEKAISILDEIRDSRKIGIISHVGDLKNRIKSNMEIIKSQTGSKIILP